MLLLECKADETLARALGCTRRNCLHLNDKGRVCNRLQKGDGETGMVDEDPGAAQPPYLQKLELISDVHDVKVFRDPAGSQKLAVVCPRLEEWVIKTAKLEGVEMRSYGLDQNANALHKEINDKLPKLRELIDGLLSLKSERLLHLKNLIA